MNRPTLTLLAAFALATLIALVLASRMGGALGGGVLTGFVVGAGLTGLGFLYQRHVLATRPERTLQAAGLTYYDTTSEAQWAVTQDRAYMVAIYCLRTRDVAVLAATGAEGSTTSSLVSRVAEQWQQTDSGPK